MMFRATMVRPLVLLTCWGAVVPQTAAAQPVSLRYRATVGEQIDRLFQAHVRVTTTADGTEQTREVARLGAMREQALFSQDDRYVLHLSYDSLVVRQRDAGGPWTESRVVLNDSLWVQLAVDPLMRVRHRVGRAEWSEGPLLQHLGTGFSGLVLPDAPVRPGTGWQLDLALPAVVATAGVAPGPAVTSLPVRARMTVDSVVVRARDTLAFISLEGTVTPSRVRGAEGVTVHYEGDAQASLVWSTGWGTFVSAATRTILAVLVERDGRRSPLTIETTIRQAVAP
jgi:hypothetical protein